MKNKSVFSKKIASFILSLSIIVSTLACLSTSYVSAVTETPAEELNPGILRKTAYDFESGNEYLDFGIQVNQNSADIAVVDDTTKEGNKCLKMYNSLNWVGMLVNLPYELENNASYRITYKLRANAGAQVREDEGGAAGSSAAGVFVGKSTGITDTLAANRLEVKNYIKNKLAFLYDVPGKTGTSMKVPVPSEWTEQSWTFTTGENTVDDAFKYLAFNFYPTGTGDSNKYSTLYLDDIVIEKLDPKVAYYDFEGDNASSDFRWWAGGSEAGSKAQVKTDTDGNKVLSFKAAKSWMNVFANLTYELEANSKYKISYRFKAIDDTKICNNYSASGVFIGKNAPNSKDGSIPRILPRLAVVYGGEKGDTNQYPTVWTNVTNEINTGDLVDNEYKYLAFNFCMTGGTVDGTYGEIYLDDIVIEKVNPNLTEYDFDKEAPTYTVKKPYNMGSSAVSVATDPDQSGNKVLEIKMIKNANKAIGVDLNYILESNTAYEISYRYKSDGKFNMPGEATTYYQSGFFPGTFQNIGGGFDYNANGVYKIAEKLTNFRDGTGNETISSSWTQVTRTFTTGTIDSSKNYLSLAIHSATNSSVDYASLYIDDLVIKKLVQVSFDTNGGEAIDTMTVEAEKKFVLPTPNKFGYTFDGWYDQNGELVGNAGDKVLCGYTDIQYVAHWTAIEKISLDFEDGSLGSALYTTTTPAVVDDPDGSANKVLELAKKSGNTYGITLPVELEPNTKYTVSFDYKVKLADGTSNIQLNPTGGTADVPVYSSSYIALADNTGAMIEDGTSPMALLFGDGLKASDNDATVGGNIWNTPNKISNTDWVTRTYSFTTAADSSAQFAMLKLVYYYSVSEDSSVYFDNVYVQKTPTATFVTGDGATEVAPITDNPGAVVTPGCPTRENYRFMGWYLNDKYAGFNTVVMPFENSTFTAAWKLQSEIGDVDGNGKIDAADLTVVRQVLLGTYKGEYDIGALNCHDDGEEIKLNVLDLVALKKKVVGVTANLGKTVRAADGTPVSGLKLVWNEEFDAASFDATSFEKSQSQGNHEGISFDNDLVKLTENGTASLEIKKNAEGNALLCSTGITTQNKMNFKYGYVEVRAKVPFNGTGEWPSIWMVSSAAKLAGKQSDRSLEVDILENMGGGTLMAQVHNWGPDRNINTDDILNLVTNNTSINYKGENEFHTYGLLWTKGSFTFYRDGVVYASYKADRDKLPLEVEDQMTDLRMGIGFNFDSDSFSIEKFQDCVYEIDYCRLYQIPSESCLLVKPAE